MLRRFAPRTFRFQKKCFICNRYKGCQPCLSAASLWQAGRLGWQAPRDRGIASLVLFSQLRVAIPSLRSGLRTLLDAFITFFIRQCKVSITSTINNHQPPIKKRFLISQLHHSQFTIHHSKFPYSTTTFRIHPSSYFYFNILYSTCRPLVVHARSYASAFSCSIFKFCRYFN